MGDQVVKSRRLVEVPGSAWSRERAVRDVSLGRVAVREGLAGESSYKLYSLYRSSDHWARLVSTYRGDACGMCLSRAHLSLHHVTYKRLYVEREVDLMTLCRRCHELVHFLAKYTIEFSLDPRLWTHDPHAARRRVMGTASFEAVVVPKARDGKPLAPQPESRESSEPYLSTSERRRRGRGSGR